MGKAQVRHSPGEAFKQGAIAGAQAQHADHGMVVGSWKRTEEQKHFCGNSETQAITTSETTPQVFTKDKYTVLI